MIDKNQIKPHMPVGGANDQQLGKVDHIQGDSLKLTRDAQGKHHLIPLDWVDRIDDKVHVNKPVDEVMKNWQTVN
jgi:hypothetical protein